MADYREFSNHTMVQAKSKLLTFADHLAYDGGNDVRDELVRGQLTSMTPPA